MSTRSAIIYSIYCIPEDKYYVGQTGASLKRRIKQHYSAGAYKGDEATLIDQTLQLYNQDDFIIQQIERCDDDLRNEREQYWISYYDCMKPNGYNCTPGGGFNRVTLTDDELEEMKKQYLQGKSLAQLSIQYDISTSTVKKYLQQLEVPIRTLQEQQQFNYAHHFYRLDEEGNLLQTYNSYSEIGQWLIENALTSLTDASRAGVAVRYAILRERMAYGFKWDTDFWTPEEKEEAREKLCQSESKRRSTKRIRPTRSQLMSALQEHRVAEIAEEYQVKDETVRKWCKKFLISVQGEDLSTPHQIIPEEYTILRAQLSSEPRRSSRPSKCPQDMEQLLYDIATQSFVGVARQYGIGSHAVAMWCKRRGYPYHIEDICRYVYENQDVDPSELVVNPLSKLHKPTPDNPSGRYPDNIDDLLIEISQTSFSAVGRKYGVNGNAVKKWCRNHGRPWHIKDVRKYVREHHLLQ